MKIQFLVFLLLVKMLAGCRRSDPVQENIGKIYGGMDKTNVVALLGHPLETVVGESPDEESWFYSPKNDIYSSDEKILVVKYFIVDFVSNKTVRTSACYGSPSEREKR